ncbi:Ribonuclease H-like domain [Cinara cedri]|uniref:DNA-directed DNA polymerase n=1 Tax=Cinara cedri TaxID=506608 RepID=A0A5E4NQV5_9HEMI|nr:Ribonuclease H-like domain [Cinara cedri]
MNTYEWTFARCARKFSMQKSNVTRRAKSHDGVKFQRALRPKSFARKDNRDIHVEIFHRDGIVAKSAIPPQAGPSMVPSTSTGPWTTDEGNDELFMDIGVDVYRVADHNHLSGIFRQTLCNTCNLKLRVPKFVPCFFHNLSNYDSHFIVTELGYYAQTISVIRNNEEKFISFSIYVSNTFSVRFIDTCRFMASSLSALASNLGTPDFGKFRETRKVFNTEDVPLVTRKGVYPDEYTDNWEKLEENTSPRKEEFYSALTETDIGDADYEHGKAVWTHFDCRTLGEYSELYLEIDVMLLVDVFENVRDICMKTYNLDPAYYYTAAGFSLDCMLKYTAIELEHLTDYDMLPMFESGNNLYGMAMLQYMPHGGFQWKEPTLDGLEELTDTSDIGRVYEVDIAYPEHLHVDHNDLPLLPNNRSPGSKVKKLMVTLEEKNNYIIHYRNLKQAIANGLIIKKIHRVLQFEQSPWLAKYISLNTEMRKKAANDFEKNVYKLMNNAVFGKMMESMRRRINIKLVSCEKRMQKLINKTKFKHCTSYNENLCAVSLENKIIHFCEPIYIGFVVLDILKTKMTKDLYVGLLKKPGLLECTDTANLPRDHSCYVAERKKIPGLF